MYLSSYSPFLPVHIADWLQLAQSPVRQPDGAASGLPFASILARMIFMPATRNDNTRNAPGAITKIVIGVNQFKERI